MASKEIIDETILENGDRRILYSDGSTDVIQPNGDKIMYDPDGNIIGIGTGSGRANQQYDAGMLTLVGLGIFALLNQ